MDTPASPSSLWDFYRTRTDWAAEWLFSSLRGRRLTSRSGSEKTRSSSPTPPSSPSASPSRQRTAPAWDSLEYTVLQYDE